MSSEGGESPFGVRHIESVIDWLRGYGVNTGIVLAVAGLSIFAYLFFTSDITSSRILAIAVFTSPLWLPFTLFFIFFEWWLYYVQLYDKLKSRRVSLEIFIPKDIFKSPAAMEAILTQLYQKASPDNLVETYWGGKHPPYYGLEIISTEGQVRLIVNTPNNKYKGYVETAFYSQYPGIEIRELPTDYTAAIPWDPDTYGMMPIHFKKKQPNPYPIKTYIDFGLDKDPDEEFKHDPMSTMLELLGTLGQGEHLWFQFLIRIHRTESFLTGYLFPTSDWKEEVQSAIEDIMGRKKVEKTEDSFKILMLSEGERDRVKALERTKSKFAFKVYIRALYVANLKTINWDRIGQAITIFQATEDQSRNSVRYSWRADFDYNWWQDPSGRKRLHLKKEELEDYKKRRYESRNGGDDGCIMSTEEIATLFHLPGAVVTTPNLVRIPSKRGEAPRNLPT